MNVLLGTVLLSYSSTGKIKQKLCLRKSLNMRFKNKEVMHFNKNFLK